MLRRSRLALFIVPSSTSPELPLFLSTKERPAGHAVGDVCRRVSEYDRHCRVRGSSHSAGSSQSTLLIHRYFSGSVVGAATTVIGVFLFLLTYAYNIGKPVVDAHREYFSKLASKDADADASGSDDDDSATPSPVEEFDDAMTDDEA
jgi:hypothetical protein